MAKTPAKVATRTSDKPVKPKKPNAARAKPKTAGTPQKANEPKTKSAKSVLKQTSGAIAQLASDILADRIVPTIEQIKSVATAALGQDETKGKKAKAKVRK